MAKRPAPPSASPAPTTRGPRNAAGPARVDVREWASGIRLSMFMVIMLSLVILAAWVLVPTLGTLIDQRQKIAALREAVTVSEDEIDALETQLRRWDDPAYIMTQARERLYYFPPGQVVYIVQNDLDPATVPPEQKPVSAELQVTPSDWMPQLLRSISAAGLAQMAAPQ